MIKEPYILTIITTSTTSILAGLANRRPLPTVFELQSAAATVAHLNLEAAKQINPDGTVRGDIFICSLFLPDFDSALSRRDRARDADPVLSGLIGGESTENRFGHDIFSSTIIPNLKVVRNQVTSGNFFRQEFSLRKIQ